MSLVGLRELLLRKTVDNNVKSFIDHMSDEKLMSYIVESIEQLEKAGGSANKGKNLNSSVNTWLSTANHTDMDLAREALGHHASHYKAALNAGNKDIANQHMRKFFDTMHLLDRASTAKSPTGDKHKMAPKVEAVHPAPWEYSKYPEAKGWGRSASTQPGAEGYSYLQEAPHPGKAHEIKIHQDKHKDKGIDFTGAYPIEHVKINDKHIPVSDVDYKGKFESHPFDSHPALSTHKVKPSNYSEDTHDWFLNQLDDWDMKDDVAESKAKYAQMKEESPEEYENIGKEMSTSIHSPVENKLDIEHAMQNKHLYPVDTTKKRSKQAIMTNKTNDVNKAPESLPVNEQSIESAKSILDSPHMDDDLKTALLQNSKLSHHHIKAAGHDPAKYGFTNPDDEE